jgi:hypothetical protein
VDTIYTFSLVMLKISFIIESFYISLIHTYMFAGWLLRKSSCNLIKDFIIVEMII